MDFYHVHAVPLQARKGCHPLERKLQVVARHRVSAGKLNRGPLQKQQVRLLIEHLLQPRASTLLVNPRPSFFQ